MSCCWTIRRATVCVVLFCAMLRTPVLCNGSSSTDNGWKITAAANEDARGEWQLDVVMEYHGEKPVELQYSEIPWKWHHAITVCAVREMEFFSSAFSPTTLVVDRPKGHLTVTPGETLTGAIPLRSLFKHWDLRWLEGPVIVFWSYKFRTSDRVGGWMEIPQPKNSEKKKDNSDRKEWKLEASVKKASREAWNLDIAIKYHGNTDTYLPRYVLPWEWCHSMILCAMRLDGRSADPIERSIIGDPPRKIMLVKPGQAIRGDITIAPLTLFNHTTKESRRYRLLVFWSIKIRSSNRVGGWFEVDEGRENGTSADAGQSRQGVAVGKRGH
jgi:hypothetical protein